MHRHLSQCRARACAKHMSTMENVMDAGLAGINQLILFATLHTVAKC